MASVGCDEDELPTTRTVPAVSDSSDSEESYVSESPDCYVAPRAATFLRNAKTSSLQDTPAAAGCRRTPRHALYANK